MNLEYYPDEYTVLGLISLRFQLKELVDRVEEDRDARSQEIEEDCGVEVK